MRWALPLVLLSLLAGCSSPPGETIEPASNDSVTTTTAATPANATTSAPPTASTPPPNATTPPTSPTPPAPGPAPRPPPEVFEKSGNTTTATVGGQSPDGAASLPFTVKPGAVKLTATLWWNSTAAPTDYDLKVHDPRACPAAPSIEKVQCAQNTTAQDPGVHADDDGAPGQPDSPAKVELDLTKAGLACTKAEGCKWSAEAFAKAAATASYHLLVVVEYA